MNRNTAHEIRTNDERLKRTSGRVIKGLGALSTGLVFMGIGALAPGPALAYLAGGAALGRIMTAGPLPDRSVQQMSAVLRRVGDKISVSTEYGGRFSSRSRKMGSVAVRSAIKNVRSSADRVLGGAKRLKPIGRSGDGGPADDPQKEIDSAIKEGGEDPKMGHYAYETVDAITGGNLDAIKFMGAEPGDLVRLDSDGRLCREDPDDPLSQPKIYIRDDNGNPMPYNSEILGTTAELKQD